MSRARMCVTAAMLMACAGTASAQFRSMDGTDNNVANPDWGRAGGNLLRLTPPAYADGISAMARPNGPSPREVSNAVIQQTQLIVNSRGLSDLVWQWGQFIDHDLDLTLDGLEEANIPTPPNDPYFLGSPIGFFRSEFDPNTGITTPRRHPNILTSYIDGSQIYGSDLERCAALRAFVGGRLLVTPSPEGDLLPYNTKGLLNVIPHGASHEDFFIAGDPRCNEQAGLTAMHTLWVREHNYWADRLAAQNPTWDDDQIFYTARMIVGAEIQKITYEDWIPALFGPDRLPPYKGYDPTVNATVANEFSAAAFRIGHTLLSPTLARLDNYGLPIVHGPLPLREAFFNLSVITDQGGIAPLLKGQASQRAQEIDNHIVEDVRSFLFGPPGSGGFDLSCLNIQRARDHGLPDYNTIREELGLGRVKSFAEITSKPEVQAALASVYPDVDSIDPWVGMICEDHVPGGSVGLTMSTIILDQFRRCRDGDRFFYLNDPAMAPYLSEVQATTLRDVIERNTGLTSLQANVFFVTPEVCYVNCDRSTVPPVLNVNDFICFMARFSAGDPYANCDSSTAEPILNVDDFVCFQGRFSAGCP